MPQPMTVPVEIAVVSWNTRELLRACLHSLHDDVDAGRAHVTVVDNGSTDGSRDAVKTDFPWAELIESDENLGYGAAVNVVAARTDSTWIAAANADIALDPDALQQLLKAADAHPDAGILAPRLIAPNGSTQHSVHPFPTLALTLAFNLGIATIKGDSLALNGRWNPETPRYVDWALGAFVLVRRAAWDQIHGFAPEQWMYAEDLDLAWRADRAGWRTWYEPSARVTHAGAASTSQAWGETGPERWLKSTYGWMIRRRGPLVTRTYAFLNTAGATARLMLLRLARGNAADREVMRMWARLHAKALLARAADLRSQR
jgi:GT2 family glycosyltransferase